VSTVPLLLARNCETCYQSEGQAGPFLAPNIGLIAPDVTQQWLPLGSDEAARGGCFSIELKPKQAEKVRSWLVDPSRASFKSQFVRVGITRAATEGRKPAPALDADYEGLFSGELKSVRRVIKASLGQQSGPVISCFLEGDRTRVPANPSRAATIVACALARESILRRLRVAQQAFDCLDIDGVAIALAAPTLVSVDVEALLEYRSAGVRLSPTAETAEKVCRCSPGKLAATKPKAREVHREEAISTLYRLEMPDLLNLLHNWLVALTLDDISIIISAMKLTIPVPSRRQTCRQMGVIRLDEKTAYAYSIAVVDAGPKSSSKLRKKIKNELVLVTGAAFQMQISA